MNGTHDTLGDTLASKVGEIIDGVEVCVLAGDQCDR